LTTKGKKRMIVFVKDILNNKKKGKLWKEIRKEKNNRLLEKIKHTREKTS